MQKLLLLLTIAFCLGCSSGGSDNPNPIQAPILPIQTLHWGMNIETAYADMKGNGYILSGDGYFCKTDRYVIWKLSAVNNRLTEVAYYFGNSDQLNPQREYWKALIKEDRAMKYWVEMLELNLCSWNAFFSETHILTQNTMIKVSVKSSDQVVTTLNGSQFKSVLKATYTGK